MKHKTHASLSGVSWVAVCVCVCVGGGWWSKAVPQPVGLGFMSPESSSWWQRNKLSAKTHIGQLMTVVTVVTVWRWWRWWRCDGGDGGDGVTVPIHRLHVSSSTPSPLSSCRWRRIWSSSVTWRVNRASSSSGSCRFFCLSFLRRVNSKQVTCDPDNSRGQRSIRAYLHTHTVAVGYQGLCLTLNQFACSV